jgi:hypothetical protein
MDAFVASRFQNWAMEQAGAVSASVVDWLLQGDPGIRWQVLRDLTDAPAADVAAERAKVATVGWGAEVLEAQRPDGTWPVEFDGKRWTTSPEGSVFVALLWLRDLGLDPASEQARTALERVRDHVTWHWWDDHPFFVGEVEPCINGRIVALGGYFGEDVSGLVERLLGEQMDDGGWNCEQENGSVRGSFSTSINVLEGFLEFERATGGSPEITAARERGNEFLLSRRMRRRLSTGEIADTKFQAFLFPPGWHYDVLRGLDYLRSAGVAPEARMDEAIELVRSKRLDDGRWLLDWSMPEHVTLREPETIEEPSRWNTLRALRVLRWSEVGPS